MKVMFSQVSVCPGGGAEEGCLPHLPWADTPLAGRHPPQGRHPPGQTPTGMHSCFMQFSAKTIGFSPNLRDWCPRPGNPGSASDFIGFGLCQCERTVSSPIFRRQRTQFRRIPDAPGCVRAPSVPSPLSPRSTSSSCA